MNTKDLTEKLPVANAEPDYDTKPLLKEIREDLSQLMRSFGESQKRADVMQESLSQMQESLSQMQESLSQMIKAFAESEKRNEAFRVEIRAEVQSLRDQVHENDLAARARHENLRLEMNQRFDRFEKKVTLMHTDILEARTDVVLLEKRIEPLEELAQIAA